MLHASFDRFPRLVESRYDEAFLYLSAHCRKRALVVLVTNVIDEVNANQIQQYLHSFVGRHLPLAVLLRDRALFDAADRQPASDEELYRAAAAAEILTWRQQVLADLSAKGVLSLDVFPEGLTAPLVNQYLDIKARHLLYSRVGLLASSTPIAIQCLDDLSMVACPFVVTSTSSE